ncbi:phosphatidylserine decarboxylase family protein [Balneolales bacterium ANBcel1]|nr:phosphatidylserine decarboxylase family protein [Balneolales bacterium ANBcel1]
MRIAKDGVPVIVAVLFLALVAVLIGWILNNTVSYLLYLVAVSMSGFTLFFFRDPERSIPEGDLLLAPADGKVISIEPVREETYLQGTAVQITIFLSLADVHVNRYPVSGTVEHVSYHPGKYLVAWHPKASELNERAEFGIKHASGTRFFYRQITGFIARRIVFYTREGDEVKAGDRFGIMKFGSRMDILVPEDMAIQIQKGDKVTAGETVIARL